MSGASENARLRHAVWRMPSDAFPFIGKASGPVVLRRAISMCWGQPVQRLSHGAKCLAHWLMRDQHRQGVFDDYEDVNGADIDRILIGMLQPGDAMCEVIDRATGGAIAPDMFDKFVPDISEVDVAPTAAPAETAEEPSVITKLHPLGEIGPGPIVQAWRHGNEYFLKLPGFVALANEGTARALHAALGKALHQATNMPRASGAGGMHGIPPR